VTEFASNLAAAVVVGIAGLLWRWRDGLRDAFGFARCSVTTTRRVRVSFSALLLVGEADRCVLFRTESRPEALGPPGGVFKYSDSARARLDRLGFVDEVWDGREESMRRDLRGFLPATSVLGFRRWFQSGVDRESAEDCLHRELCEELVEVGLMELVSTVALLDFRMIRIVPERPRKVPGQEHLQFRRFEIYEIASGQEVAADFVRRLFDVADDPINKNVECVRLCDLTEGRCRTGLIAPHTAYLRGSRKLASDIPPVRRVPSL
jgi:hypothetical protein